MKVPWFESSRKMFYDAYRALTHYFVIIVNNINFTKEHILTRKQLSPL